jgi:hypothetical protein
MKRRHLSVEDDAPASHRRGDQIVSGVTSADELRKPARSIRVEQRGFNQGHHVN